MSQQQKNSNLIEVLSFTAEKTLELSNANSVLGDAVEKEGTTVIPVSELSVGFAGGGSDSYSGKKQRHPAGAGGKVTRKPVGFVVIDKDGAHMLGSAAAQKASPLSSLLGALKSLPKKDKKKKDK